MLCITSPLDKFKVFTVKFAAIYSIVLFIVGLLFIHTWIISLAIILHAICVYWCGSSIYISLKSEERTRILKHQNAYID